MSDQLKVDGAERDRMWRKYCSEQRRLKKLKRAGKLKPKKYVSPATNMHELIDAIHKLDEEGLKELHEYLNGTPDSQLTNGQRSASS